MTGGIFTLSSITVNSDYTLKLKTSDVSPINLEP